jgi:lipid-A-disaccharide synthase
VALLPGSRRKELTANLPEMLQVAVELDRKVPCEYLLPIASTISVDGVKKQIEGFAGTLPRVVTVEDAREALYHARASVVASGTATVQAALIGNPFVVVYRVSDMTYRVARRLVRYPTEIPAPADEHGDLPIGMVNLIAGRRIVPELIQERFNARSVVAALRPLLAEGADRDRMIADLADVRKRLEPSSGANSIERVCNAVEVLLKRPATQSGRISSVSV